MENQITFNVDGHEFKVKLPSAEEVAHQISMLKMEAEDEYYYNLYEDERASQEDSLEDISMMEQMLNLYLTAPTMLLEHVKGMKKKKNGTFWKRAVNTLFTPEHLSNYYEEYTAAWRTPEICLEVISDTECELTITERTITH